MTAPLDKLHDFYQPPPPSWRPQTIGWYVVFAIAALLLLWLVVHLMRRWIANRYRREAMRELVSANPEQLSELLKRTALSAWPREKVAALSGERVAEIPRRLRAKRPVPQCSRQPSRRSRVQSRAFIERRRGDAAPRRGHMDQEHRAHVQA